jgi:hypothetical protein
MLCYKERKGGRARNKQLLIRNLVKRSPLVLELWEESIEIPFVNFLKSLKTDEKNVLEIKRVSLFSTRFVRNIFCIHKLLLFSKVP